MTARTLWALLFVVMALALMAISVEISLYRRFILATVSHPYLPVDVLFSMILAAAALLPAALVVGAARRRRLRRALVREIARAARASSRDHLTGLANRQRLIAAIETRDRSESLPPTVMVIDVSGVRQVNRQHGHRIADALLKDTALRIEATCDDSDLVARIGGADFAVLLGEGRHRNSAEELAAALIVKLEAEVTIRFRRLRLRANIGIAPGVERGEGDEGLLSAERALREAMATGPGRYAVFDGEDRSRSQHEELVRQSLVTSIERDEVEPAFQPIVNLGTGRIEGVEVLARWPHAKHRISPADYIVAAERDGSIGALTDLLLVKACRTLKELGSDIWMSFNLSAQEFVDPTLAERVLSTLSLYGVDPRQFVIEITETAVVADMRTARSIIATFRKAGVRVALDDFGTGASSLTLLAELPLDRMKIDRSFVTAIDTNASNAQIVRSMIVLADALGLSVVVEGIETPAEHRFLVRLGCVYGQGYLYGRPCSAAQLPRLLQTGSEYPPAVIAETGAA